MSTENSSGFYSSKNSSRVLQAPGGAQSFNLFGGYEEEKPSKPKTEPTTNLNNNNPDPAAKGDEATNGADSSGQDAKADESEAAARATPIKHNDHDIFGAPTRDNIVSGKRQSAHRVNAITDDYSREALTLTDGAEFAKGMFQSESKSYGSPRSSGIGSRAAAGKQSLSDVMLSPGSRRRRGNYNPITGEDYEENPKPRVVKQPPGGKSSGIF